MACGFSDDNATASTVPEPHGRRFASWYSRLRFNESHIQAGSRTRAPSDIQDRRGLIGRPEPTKAELRADRGIITKKFWFRLWRLPLAHGPSPANRNTVRYSRSVRNSPAASTASRSGFTAAMRPCSLALSRIPAVPRSGMLRRIQRGCVNDPQESAAPSLV
jgi:hypothetical protein